MKPLSWPECDRDYSSNQPTGGVKEGEEEEGGGLTSPPCSALSGAGSALQPL